jgi:hypothetical protein
MDENKAVLVKICEEERHIEFFRSGNIRLKGQKTYFDLDEISLTNFDRYDNFEGSDYIVQPDEGGNADTPLGKVWVAKGSSQIALSFRDIISPEANDPQKIFCLYMLKEGEPVDKRIEGFGQYFSLIYMPDVFLSRLKSKLDLLMTSNEIANYVYGPVKYKDLQTHSGFINPHVKRDELAWQNEYRIFVEKDVSDPYVINIGDIHDISLQGLTKNS